MKKRFESPTFVEKEENFEKHEQNMELPKEIKEINKKLVAAGFESYLVGGCVRDFLLEKNPKDWDLTTSAKPEEIQKIFPESIYENKFGTVAIKTDSKNPILKIVEATTFRKEGKYTDKRHPDEITFAKNIEEDLSRRDFTINALALDISGKKRKIVDPFGGEKDLEKKIIRAVGNPKERFEEDALRLMRAVRFAAQLGFSIEKETLQAIKEKSGLIEFVSEERIRDEFVKLLMTERAHEGVQQLQKTGLLKHIWPELVNGIDVTQNKHHIYTVYEHNIRSFEYAVKKNFPLHIRVASLLHDVAKPQSKRGEGLNCTFYGHQILGERMALKMLDKLRFPKEITEKVALLIREHMFVYDPETVTLAGVRRLLSRVGTDNIDDLLKLREADRIGSGVPKAQPYRLRYLKAMVEKVKTDPISAKMIKVNGTDVMKIAKIEPSPKVGKLLAILLEEILENPKNNEKETLTKRVTELSALNDAELDKLAGKAKQTASETQERIDEDIKKKYFV